MRARATNLTFAPYSGVKVRLVARRGLVALVAAVALALTAAPGARAHPLGNFSVNHISTVSVSDDHVDVRYVLDQAEIPTVQEEDLSPAEVLARKRDEVERRLVLLLDGRRVELVPAGSTRPASSSRCEPTSRTRAGWSCVTARSPGGSGGRR
jgi:hypothetical protein